MARKIEFQRDRLDDKAGLVVIALLFGAIFFAVRRDSSPSKKPATPAAPKKKPKPAEEPAQPVKFVNFEPEPLTPATKPTGIRTDGEVRSERGSVTINPIPTDVQNFSSDVGSRWKGDFSQLDFYRKGLPYPDRQTANPDRIDHTELVTQFRGQGWHGEHEGAVAIALLQQEGGLDDETLGYMGELEKHCQPVVYLYTDTPLPTTSDGDLFVRPWANIPKYMYRFVEMLERKSIFNHANLAMLMWTAARKEIHWIREHPLVPLKAAVSEAHAWAVREADSDKEDDYSIARVEDRVNLLFGWFALPFRGCGQNGAFYAKLESWAGGVTYREVPDNIRLGVSKTEYLMLVWLAWMGRRWMMKRTFTRQSGELLDGSARVIIQPRTASGTVPDLHMDVTLFVPTGLVDGLFLNIPEETHGPMSRKWNQSQYLQWALNRVRLEARAYVQDATAKLGKNEGNKGWEEEGPFTVPFVNLRRLFFRPGIPFLARCNGEVEANAPAVDFTIEQHLRPPRMSVIDVGDRVVSLLKKPLGNSFIVALHGLLNTLRPDHIEFLNRREYHWIDVAQGEPQQAKLYSDNQSGFAQYLLLMAIHLATQSRYENSAEVDRNNAALNSQYRSFDNDPYAKAIKREGRAARRHMRLDFGGLLLLATTEDKIGQFEGPARLDAVQGFVLPLLDMVRDEDVTKNQPSTDSSLNEGSIILPVVNTDPCIYYVMYAWNPKQDPSLTQETFNTDQLRFWGQLREHYITALRFLLGDKEETPEQTADRVMMLHQRLQRLLNTRIRVGIGAQWQPNIVEPPTLDLAFQYFDGDVPLEKQKADLMSKLGNYVETAMHIDSKFTANTVNGGYRGSVDVNRIVTDRSPAPSPTAGFGFREIGELDPFDDDNEFEHTPHTKIGKMLAARKACTEQLQQLVTESWAPFKTQQLDRYATAANQEELEEAKKLFDGFAEAVDNKLKAAWELFKQEVEKLAEDANLSGPKPKRYENTNGRWIQQPLLLAQKGGEGFYNTVQEAYIRANHRIKPSRQSVLAALELRCREKCQDIVKHYEADLTLLASTGKAQHLAEERGKGANTDNLADIYIDIFTTFGEAEITKWSEQLYAMRPATQQSITLEAWTAGPGASGCRKLDDLCGEARDKLEEDLRAIKKRVMPLRVMSTKEIETAREKRFKMVATTTDLIKKYWNALSTRYGTADKSGKEKLDASAATVTRQTKVVDRVCGVNGDLVKQAKLDAEMVGSHPPWHLGEPSSWVAEARGTLMAAIEEGRKRLEGAIEIPMPAGAEVRLPSGPRQVGFAHLPPRGGVSGHGSRNLGVGEGLPRPGASTPAPASSRNTPAGGDGVGPNRKVNPEPTKATRMVKAFEIGRDRILELVESSESEFWAKHQQQLAATDDEQVIDALEMERRVYLERIWRRMTAEWAKLEGELKSMASEIGGGDPPPEWSQKKTQYSSGAPKWSKSALQMGLTRLDTSYHQPAVSLAGESRQRALSRCKNSIKEPAFVTDERHLQLVTLGESMLAEAEKEWGAWQGDNMSHMALDRVRSQPDALPTLIANFRATASRIDSLLANRWLKFADDFHRNVPMGRIDPGFRNAGPAWLIWPLKKIRDTIRTSFQLPTAERLQELGHYTGEGRTVPLPGHAVEHMTRDAEQAIYRDLIHEQYVRPIDQLVSALPEGADARDFTQLGFALAARRAACWPAASRLWSDLQQDDLDVLNKANDMAGASALKKEYQQLLQSMASVVEGRMRRPAIEAFARAQGTELKRSAEGATGGVPDSHQRPAVQIPAEHAQQFKQEFADVRAPVLNKVLKEYNVRVNAARNPDKQYDASNAERHGEEFAAFCQAQTDKFVDGPWQNLMDTVHRTGFDEQEWAENGQGKTLLEGFRRRMNGYVDVLRQETQRLGGVMPKGSRGGQGVAGESLKMHGRQVLDEINAFVEDLIKTFNKECGQAAALDRDGSLREALQTLATSCEQDLQDEVDTRWKEFVRWCGQRRNPDDKSEFDDGHAYVTWLGSVKGDMDNARQACSGRISAIVDAKMAAADSRQEPAGDDVREDPRQMEPPRERRPDLQKLEAYYKVQLNEERNVLREEFNGALFRTSQVLDTLVADWPARSRTEHKSLHKATTTRFLAEFQDVCDQVAGRLNDGVRRRVQEMMGDVTDEMHDSWLAAQTDYTHRTERVIKHYLDSYREESARLGREHWQEKVLHKKLERQDIPEIPPDTVMRPNDDGLMPMREMRAIKFAKWDERIKGDIARLEADLRPRDGQKGDSDNRETNLTTRAQEDIAAYIDKRAAKLVSKCNERLRKRPAGIYEFGKALSEAEQNYASFLQSIFDQAEMMRASANRGIQRVEDAVANLPRDH